MHRDFLKQLPAATGVSELVIVANADIRGFSKFSLEVESVEAAVFIKKVYRRLLETYFSGADFFKPTGDGLLVIFRVAEDTLAEQSNDLIEKSISLVSDFPVLFTDDPVINFAVPSGIGIGIARGAATRLVSGDMTLDYSGKVLNLASRLMDFARPRGVVFDESFGPRLIRPDLAARFQQTSIYVRSVAESAPLQVHYTEEWATIPASAKRPLDAVEWRVQERKSTLKDLRDANTSRFLINLEHKPLDEEDIFVEAEHPDVLPNGRRGTLVVKPRAQFSYEERAGKPVLAVNFSELAARLASKGVKLSWPVTLRIHYPT